MLLLFIAAFRTKYLIIFMCVSVASTLHSRGLCSKLGLESGSGQGLGSGGGSCLVWGPGLLLACLCGLSSALWARFWSCLRAVGVLICVSVVGLFGAQPVWVVFCCLVLGLLGWLWLGVYWFTPWPSFDVLFSFSVSFLTFLGACYFH